MANCYVIMETYYSYDDQIYRDENSGFGKPFIAFSTKESAEINLKKLTKDFFETADVFDYCSHLSDIIDKDVLEPFILAGKITESRRTLRTWSRDSGKEWKSLTDDERKLLLENCSITPYYIQEVEIVDG